MAEIKKRKVNETDEPKNAYLSCFSTSGAEVGDCEPVTIGAVIFPQNRFVSLRWEVQVTQQDGTDLDGAVPAIAQKSADGIL